LIFTCDTAGALYKRAKSAPNSYAIALPENTNDRSFAMTSSFTGMLLAAALALRAIAPRSERSTVLADLARQVLPESLSLLRGLANRYCCRVVYSDRNEIQRLSSRWALTPPAMTAGKLLPSASSPLGFRHGPNTTLNPHTLVVVFVCNDEYTRQYDPDLVDE